MARSCTCAVASAVCVRFDYPHVYWRWTDDIAVQAAIAARPARTCGEAPQLLVHSGDLPSPVVPRSAGPVTIRTGSPGRSRCSRRTPRTRTTRPRNARRPSGRGGDSSRTRWVRQAVRRRRCRNPATSSRPAPPPLPRTVRLARSLMSMFSRRPEKAIFTNVHDAGEEVVHAAAPQSVSIENSQRARFRVEKKVTSLTLLQCEDVEVEFLAVISSVRADPMQALHSSLHADCPDVPAGRVHRQSDRLPRLPGSP